MTNISKFSKTNRTPSIIHTIIILSKKTQTRTKRHKGEQLP